METTFLMLKCGATHVNIYRRPKGFYASIFGQLPLYGEGDSLERSNAADLMIALVEEVFDRNYPVEVYDPITRTWSNF